MLTAFNNPVTYKQGYRHLLVNTLQNLILLDQYIVSDEELVEKAKFPPKFARFSPNFEVRIARAPAQNCDTHNHLSIILLLFSTVSTIQFNLREFSSHSTPARQLWLHREELSAIRSRHRRHSPVLTIQRVFRGFLVRRALTLFHIAASIIQRAVRRFLARRRRRAAWKQRHEIRRQHLLGINCLYIAQTGPLTLAIFAKLVHAAEVAHKQTATLVERCVGSFIAFSRQASRFSQSLLLVLVIFSFAIPFPEHASTA